MKSRKITVTVLSMFIGLFFITLSGKELQAQAIPVSPLDRAASRKWREIKEAELTNLFNNLKDELDNKKDKLRDEMMAILKENQIDGTKLEGSELEHYNEFEKQLGEIAGKEDFLDEIENLSPGELVKKRDELAVEADTSGKYALLLDYMEAEDKNKFLADKRIELNNQKTKLMMLLAQATEEDVEGLKDMIQQVTDLENFITEIEYLDASGGSDARGFNLFDNRYTRLADKKDELLKQILNDPSDETIQWKLDILGQVLGVYEKGTISFKDMRRHMEPVSPKHPIYNNRGERYDIPWGRKNR